MYLEITKRSYKKKQKKFSKGSYNTLSIRKRVISSIYYGEAKLSLT